MAKLKALRNISNRPLELIFNGGAERILPKKTGKYHAESEWKGTLAEKQADEFVKRREAKYVEKNENEVSQPTEANTTQNQQKKSSKG